MSKSLIINFLAGPSAGKSSLVSGLFSELKWLDVNCELVTEFAKDLVWEERFKTMENQFYIFGKQLNRIERLIDKVDFIICDSPLLLSIIYKPIYVDSSHYDKVILEVFNKFNNLNFYVLREKDYNQVGRVQSENEAKEIDGQILEMLYKYDVPFRIVWGQRSSIDKIVNTILQIH